MPASPFENRWSDRPPSPLSAVRRMAHVRDCSPFAAGLLDLHPSWTGGVEERRAPGLPDLSAQIAGLGLDRGLRQFRNRQMLGIIWRDLCGLASLDETFADLTGLAQDCIEAALAEHEARLQQRHGTPTAADGTPQRMAVIGLGKLGGGELNLSSDIDLVFCFGEGGETRGEGRKPLSNEEYFIRLARAVISSLSEVTADGFCFRVDTRLRPFGDAGALCSSLAALEQYYQREGRDWERYALIKARPVAGDQALGGRLMEQVRPFVYRRYIDFGAIEALQEMHAAVREEALRKDLLDDIKRGPGGIREIEFLVQCFQLLRGGREPGLQTPSLLQALRTMAELELLSPATLLQIREDYVFLRQLENRNQALRDQQTHRVPGGEDLERLARAMGQRQGEQLLGQLQAVRGRVEKRFQDIFPSQPEPEQEPRWAQAWRELQAAPQAPSEGGAPAVLPVEQFVRRLEKLALSQRARLRLDRFMPLLLHRLERHPLAEQTLHRVFDLVLAICRRSAYLVLLVQNAPALDRMISLFARSEWIAATVTRFPALLDELIDPSLGRQIPSAAELRASVDRLLAPAQGAENALEGLNYLKLATSLRIAVAQLEGALDGRAAQAALAETAAALLQGVLDLASREVETRHGRPAGSANSLAVIAYGSFGAGELTYDSDLDVVFLFRGTDPPADGESGLPAERYYARLCQRVLSFLAVTTPSGRLYPVDTRLRPNGRAGSLVSSLEAFSDYQLHSAWTWELQALTRARFVAGNPETGSAFDRIRSEVLQQARDPVALRQDLASMRARMAAERQRAGAAGDALKHGPGALVDIEFIVQLGVLGCAHRHPQVAQSSATLDQLQALVNCGWIPAAAASTLERTALTLRQQRMLRILAPRESETAPDLTEVAALFRQLVGDSAEQA